MNSKSIKIVLGVTALVLLVPFMAMLFTDEVAWNLMDFAVAALLLAGTGFLISFAVSRIDSLTYRVLAIVGMLLVLALVWAELAVGLFGTPFAGS